MTLRKAHQWHRVRHHGDPRRCRRATAPSNELDSIDVQLKVPNLLW